jgi:hypothetical protein
MDIVTPPPSPTAIFNESSSDGYYEVEKVITPVKRTANPKILKTRKRKKPNPPKAPKQQTSTTSLESLGAGMELHYEEQHDDTDGYQAYVMAVEEQRAGFHPLSRNVYVVQGWNNEHKCVKTVCDS